MKAPSRTSSCVNKKKKSLKELLDPHIIPGVIIQETKES
jgi:hypothetical protein